MLLDEDVGVKLGDPLLALDRPLQVAQRRVEIGLDLRPEETRKLLRQIGCRLVAELARMPGLDKLVVECIELARMVRIAQLPDQVGRTDQRRLGVGRCMIAVVATSWTGKLKHFTGDDVARDQDRQPARTLRRYLRG